MSINFDNFVSTLNTATILKSSTAEEFAKLHAEELAGNVNLDYNFNDLTWLSKLSMAKNKNAFKVANPDILALEMVFEIAIENSTYCPVMLTAVEAMARLYTAIFSMEEVGCRDNNEVGDLVCSDRITKDIGNGALILRKAMIEANVDLMLKYSPLLLLVRNPEAFARHAAVKSPTIPTLYVEVYVNAFKLAATYHLDVIKNKAPQTTEEEIVQWLKAGGLDRVKALTGKVYDGSLAELAA